MPLSPKRVGGVTYALIMFVIVSVLSGVLIAGLFVPMAGLAGASSKAAAGELDNIPAALETPVPPTRSRILMANGKTLAYFYAENRIYVPLSKIAPVMRQAQMAIEDHRFYEHGALDIKGTLRALIRNSASEGGTQGGSSITQQYVKMVLVESCQGDADCVKSVTTATGAEGYQRKIRELRYAIAVEKKLTKDQILERYLNIAYYGDGAYGVEAAARHYYNKSASALNLSEAALLAGLVQNPDANNPMNNKSAALERRDVVLNRMASADVGMITSAQAAAAKKAGFDTKKVKSTRNGCVAVRYPFLCKYVEDSIKQMPSLGRTPAERINLLQRGGLTVKTMIDPTTQDTAQKAVSRVVGAKDPLIATMNMIQPGTGLIVASAQSRPVMGSNTKKGETWWNLSADSTHSGIQGYQAGSTFKAFTAAAALEKGIPLTKKFNAKARMDFTGRAFNSCDGRYLTGKFKVGNSTHTNGNMNMYRGAQMSVNTYFVQLEYAAGMCNVVKMADKLGVKQGAQIGKSPQTMKKGYYDKPAFTLGSVEVAPMSMAVAYATFAARGIQCDPIIIKSITTRNGKNLDVPDGNCKRVISEDVADGVNKLLSSVMTKGTGTRARTADGRPQAGKTGTIDSNEAVWFMGYTPEIAGAAMISIDGTRKPFNKNKRASFRRSGVKGYVVPSTGIPLEGSGSGDAGMKIWKPTMEKYLKDIPRTAFHEPPSRIINGKMVQVPSLYGLSIRAATKKLEKAGFTVETQFQYSDDVPKGSFMGFSPNSGYRIQQFGTVYANFSKGKDPEKVKAEKAAKKKAAEEKKKKKAEAAQRPPNAGRPPG